MQRRVVRAQVRPWLTYQRVARLGWFCRRPGSYVKLMNQFQKGCVCDKLFSPDSLIQINGPRGSCVVDRAPRGKSSVSHIWKERETRCRPEAGSNPRDPTDGVLTAPYLFMSVPPTLSFASPSRSFWNRAAITHSVVKGRVVAFLERNTTL